ncbi:hypothetical protein D3C72_915390 [compost metagenome]
MHRFADAFDSELGRTIHAPAHVGLVAAERRDVDHVAAALATHVGQYGAGYVEQPENVGGEQPFGFAGAGFFYRAEHAKTGIVDQHVDLPEMLDASSDRRMGVLFAGHIQPHGQQVRVPAKASLDVFRVTRRCDDGVTRCQGLLGDQGAETAGSASNEPGTHINSSCIRPCTMRVFSMS